MGQKAEKKEFEGQTIQKEDNSSETQSQTGDEEPRKNGDGQSKEPGTIPKSIVEILQQKGIDPEEDPDIAKSITIALNETRSHQSSYPAPEDVIIYSHFDPRFLPTLIDMKVKEQQHRHEMEKLMQPKRAKMIGRTNVMAFVIVMALLGLGALCILTNKPIFGIILLGLVLTSVITSFTVTLIKTKD